MKKKDKKEVLIDALGKGAREEYLTDNPHGFKAVKKVHKSKRLIAEKVSIRKNIELGGFFANLVNSEKFNTFVKQLFLGWFSSPRLRDLSTQQPIIYYKKD